MELHLGVVYLGCELMSRYNWVLLVRNTLELRFYDMICWNR